MGTLTCLYVALIFEVATCAQTVEDGRVDDPIFKSLGYSCLSPNKEVGPMKAGETKIVRGTCSVYECGSGGFILLTTCLLPEKIPFLNCKIIDGDSNQAYPECCRTVQC